MPCTEATSSTVWIICYCCCFYGNSTDHRSQGLPDKHHYWVSSPSAPTVSSILLPYHKISGPPGKEQSTEQHSVAEENKFEDFLECPEEADKQGLHIQVLLLSLLPATKPSQVPHVFASAHPLNEHICQISNPKRRDSWSWKVAGSSLNIHVLHIILAVWIKRASRKTSGCVFLCSKCAHLFVS